MNDPLMRIASYATFRDLSRSVVFILSAFSSVSLLFSGRVYSTAFCRMPREAETGYGQKNFHLDRWASV